MVDAKKLALEEGVHEVSQSCFLKAEKKNGNSFVKQLWLRTRRSGIQCDMKQSNG